MCKAFSQYIKKKIVLRRINKKSISMIKVIFNSKFNDTNIKSK